VGPTSHRVIIFVLPGLSPTSRSQNPASLPHISATPRASMRSGRRRRGLASSGWQRRGRTASSVRRRHERTASSDRLRLGRTPTGRSASDHELQPGAEELDFWKAWRRRERAPAGRPQSSSMAARCSICRGAPASSPVERIELEGRPGAEVETAELAMAVPAEVV
jgi:hypothetical protein